MPPDKWETGTQNHEGMAGVTAAIDYLAGLGVDYGRSASTESRREKLVAAWAVIGAYEQMLTERLVNGLLSVPGVRVYGLTEREDLDRRVATVSLRKEGTTPEQLARALAQENIFAWNGDFYAQSLRERMGAGEGGGWLRLGLVHYNTVAEIERCLGVLEGV